MEFSTFYRDKVCVITGAGSGIGRSLAIALGRAGASLALSDINEEGLAETVQLAGISQSNRLMTDRLDVADANAIPVYARKVEDALGPADYVFNVAGVARIGNFDNSPLTSFEQVMNINFYGVVRMSKAFLDQLKKTRGGLVNISSVFGLMGHPGQAEYCAAKFAVRGFSEAVALELEDSGVSVSSVHPGGVDTNIARNAEIDALADPTTTRDDMAASFKKSARTTPEKAAEIILKGVARKKKRILVGGDAKIIQGITRLLPVSYPKILRYLDKNAYEKR